MVYTEPTLFDISLSVNKISENLPPKTHIEQLLANALDRANVPPYECEYPIDRYRGDFVFPEQRLVVECDGFDYHSTPAQRTKDAKRDRRLQLLGFHVIRFTGSEIWADAGRCVLEIQSMIGKLKKEQDDMARRIVRYAELAGIETEIWPTPDGPLVTRKQ